VSGNFWAILGRALLTVIGGWIASFAVQTAFGAAIQGVIIAAVGEGDVQVESPPAAFGEPSGFLVTRGGAPAQFVEAADVISPALFLVLVVLMGLTFILTSTAQQMIPTAGGAMIYVDRDGPYEDKEAVEAVAEKATAAATAPGAVQDSPFG